MTYTALDLTKEVLAQELVEAEACYQNKMSLGQVAAIHGINAASRGVPARWFSTWSEVPIDLDTCPICQQKFSKMTGPVTKCLEHAWPEMWIECQACQAEGSLTWAPETKFGDLLLRSKESF